MKLTLERARELLGETTDAPKRLLTIQDISCVGQCSATVALPVVSACGVECAVLPSAVLSNHTGGFPSWTFRDLTDEMPRIEAEWRRQGIRFDAFYTGYVCPQQIGPILSIQSSCAALGALRFVDPAMADNGKLYAGFGPDFPAQMARLCAGADYLLPNLTEAALLLGREPVLEGYGRAFVEETVAGLHALGAKNVVLTGVSFNSVQLGTAVSDGETLRYDFNPRLPRNVHGTGDLFAAVFAGAVLRGRDALGAAALAADVVCAAIETTPESHWYGVAFERAIPLLVSRLEGAHG
ncbi:MAG: bifunctional hydroxymethylpyrimidine kinase/phosphomethylpyrimidine kinase [Kiritimatiellae bacterium]|nr:bifunctional hydroxymethylpyrimidine kinase/phosphomethylpyrimidine kinase [Kiritimatiellia bacterium]